jgi:hypothetical protein
MRFAIVGNGPSAAGQGPEIDGHDFVVRCGAFACAGAARAGSRLDAWAWFGCPLEIARLGGRVPEGDYQVWNTKALDQWGCSDWVNPRELIARAAGRPVRWATESLLAEEVRCCGAEPSTGFTAVDMAIRMVGAPEVSLYGFDATTPEAPGWGDAATFDLLAARRGARLRADDDIRPSNLGRELQDLGPIWEWRPGVHDFAREKALLAELRDNGLWLGQPCPVRLVWPGANLLAQGRLAS